MVSKFEEMVYNGSISQELLAAQSYLSGPAAQDNHKQPMGVTTPKVSSRDICEQFRKAVPPVSMSFSGTIWMLD